MFCTGKRLRSCGAIQSPPPLQPAPTWNLRTLLLLLLGMQCNWGSPLEEVHQLFVRICVGATWFRKDIVRKRFIDFANHAFS
mmetsp:Transcript_6366/g.10767  ORF Transcript_6366/g.10767 Transcript_6366/m.10767 type:complete len:82 (+) Transcript_6366:112-357(+)